MAQLRRYSPVKEGHEATSVDALLGSMRRLVSYRGFHRDQVASAVLKRYLPFSSGYGSVFDEGYVRRTIEKAALDDRTIRYLKTACDDQLDLLRKGD